MSSLIAVTVDGLAREIEPDQRPTQLFAERSTVVVARINGELRDLWTELHDGDVVEAIEIESPGGLAVLRARPVSLSRSDADNLVGQDRGALWPWPRSAGAGRWPRDRRRGWSHPHYRKNAVAALPN